MYGVRTDLSKIVSRRFELSVEARIVNAVVIQHWKDEVVSRSPAHPFHGDSPLVSLVCDGCCNTKVSGPGSPNYPLMGTDKVPEAWEAKHTARKRLDVDRCIVNF